MENDTDGSIGNVLVSPARGSRTSRTRGQIRNLVWDRVSESGSSYQELGPTCNVSNTLKNFYEYGSKILSDDSGSDVDSVEWTRRR